MKPTVAVMVLRCVRCPNDHEALAVVGDLALTRGWVDAREGEYMTALGAGMELCKRVRRRANELATDARKILVRRAASLVEVPSERFRGRAALVAVAKLEARGRIRYEDAELAQQALLMPSREREIAAVRGELGAHNAAIIHPRWKEIANLRRERTERSRSGGDRLAARRPGMALQRAIRRALRLALEEAGFREATHDHRNVIEIVDEGREAGLSATGQARPGDVGLPNAYAKKAFFVTTSVHTWHVSRAILRVPRAERAGHGWVRLSNTVVIRQGRGTGLTRAETEIG